MSPTTYTTVLSLLLLICHIYSTQAAPQFPQRGFGTSPKPDEAPEPYDFQYKVDNPPTNTYFGQTESGDSQGRVIGSYYVLLPDGRLMNVEYTVEGESGFVPRITFSPQTPPGTTATRLG